MLLAFIVAACLVTALIRLRGTPQQPQLDDDDLPRDELNRLIRSTAKLKQDVAALKEETAQLKEEVATLSDDTAALHHHELDRLRALLD